MNDENLKKLYKAAHLFENDGIDSDRISSAISEILEPVNRKAVNGRRVDIPDLTTKVGDKLTLKNSGKAALCV